MKNRMWLGLGIAALALSACQQNPFKSFNGTITEKQIEQKVVYPDYVIATDDVAYCTEMQMCMVDIRPQVPSPGQAKMVASQLPPGATAADFAWDDQKKVYRLLWMPSNDIVDPTKGTGITTNIPFEVWLWSTAQPGTIITKMIQINVKNKPRPWTISAQGVGEVKEGELLTQTITVNNLDYPKGPFQLAALNAPVGMKIEQDASNPLKFTATYRPDFSFVKAVPENKERIDESVRGRSNYRKTIRVTYAAKDPGEGIEQRVETNWTIRDVRQASVISGPATMAMRDKALFSVRADDMNGETPPEFALDGQPPFGVISLTKNSLPGTPGTSYPTSWLNVDWSNIPPEAQGKTVALNFKACVDNGWFEKVCTPFSMKVDFQFQIPPPPAITRANWPGNEFKYTRVGQMLKVGIPIEDVEEKSRAVNVEIYPESIRDQVAWNAGYLYIQPKHEGRIQIKVLATTVPGQIQAESFFLEALPQDWSEVVILSSDREKPETKALLSVMPKAEVVHPLFQRDDRTFALRKMFLVTTELLAPMSSASDWKWLDSKMSAVENLWIATPFVDKLIQNSAYVAKLMKDRELEILGRKSKVLPASPLADFWLEIGKEGGAYLDEPKKVVTVAGTLTSQSSDPTFVQPIRGTKQCSTILNMKSSIALVGIAAVCDHQASGKLVVFGTEFSDFVFMRDDADLLKTWVAKILTAGGVTL